MSEVECPLCGKKVKQFKRNSHVIPKSFLKETFGPSGRLLAVETDKQKKSVVQDGYKGDYWCEACEKSSEKYDDYAAKILLKKNESSDEKLKLSIRSIEIGSEKIGEEWTNIDFQNLKKFILSVVYRYYLYDLQADKKFQPSGKYLEFIRKNLNDNLDDRNLPIVAARLEGVAGIVSYPILHRISGMFCVEFFLDRFRFVIPLYSDIERKPFFKIRLRSSGSMFVIVSKKEDTKWYRDLSQKVKLIDSSTSEERKNKHLKQLGITAL